MGSRCVSPLLWASSCDAELTATLQSEQYSRRRAFSSSVSGSASGSTPASGGGMTFDPSSLPESGFVSEFCEQKGAGDGAAGVTEGFTNRTTEGGAAPSAGRWEKFVLVKRLRFGLCQNDEFIHLCFYSSALFFRFSFFCKPWNILAVKTFSSIRRRALRLLDFVTFRHFQIFNLNYKKNFPRELRQDPSLYLETSVFLPFAL